MKNSYLLYCIMLASITFSIHDASSQIAAMDESYKISPKNIEFFKQNYEQEIINASRLSMGLWATGSLAVGAIAYKFYNYRTLQSSTPTEQQYATTQDLQRLEKLINQSGPLTWKQWIINNAWNLGQAIAFQLALDICGTALIKKTMALSEQMPNSGNLSWYITNRTNFFQNINDLNRYNKNGETIENHAALKLFITDIEKIIGYIKQIRHPNYTKPSAAIITRLDDICANLIKQTNNLIDIINNKYEFNKSLTIINQEIESAKSWIK